MGKIYKIQNLVNNKIYVGKTCNEIEHRFKEHIVESRYNDKRKLHKAIRKYGSDNFQVILIEDIDDESLNEREIFWINELNSFKKGYNMSKGGDGGDTSKSENYILGMSKRNYSGNNNPMFGKYGEQNPNYGKKRTLSQKEALKEGLIKSWTPERKKLHSKLFGKENNPMFGKVPKNAVKVKYNDIVYNSAAEAARMNNISVHYLFKNGAKKYNE